MEIDVYSLQELYRKNLSFEERKKEYEKYQPDDEDSYGNTVFHITAKFADSEIFEYFFMTAKLQGKTKIFKTNKYGQTPFFMLNDIKNPEEKYEDIKKIIKILTENGGNINKRDESGEIFYHKCADYQKYTIFEIMNELEIKYDKPILSNGWNVLHIACASLHRIDYYLKNEEEYKKQEEPYLRTIKAILNSGIDIDTKTAIEKLAYDLAFETRNKRACSLLKNADEDDKTFGIGLHEACWFGYEDIVKEYILRKSDLNEIYEGNMGELKKLSPLAIASKHLHKDIVKILIENGADVCERDGENGLSSFYYFAKTMINTGVNIKGKKTKENFQEITKYYLKDENFLNSYVDDEYNTPVNLLCSISNRFNWIEEEKAEFVIFEKLIDSGADVNIGDKNGNTPLHKLFKNGGDKIADMTELLMENGADPNSKNIDGETPLMLLSNIWREEEGIEALEILENYNVDTSITNNKGETALDTALKMKKEKLAQYLMNIGG